MYWNLGADIVMKQTQAKWGEGFLLQLSKDLSAEFPDIKGFSKRNLELIRQWYVFYSRGGAIGQQPVGLFAKQPVSQLNINPIWQQAVAKLVQPPVAQLKDGPIVQQPVGQLGQEPVAQLAPPAPAQILQIPWGHNIVIITKCKDITEALYYAGETLANGWSRSTLRCQIEGRLYKRSGKAVTNFSATLPAPQSDLARQMIKDPYTFDFMPAASGYREKDLEQGLLDHIQKFLVELGVGFAFVGRQVPFEIGGKDFYLDLLFYHLRLRCYVVIELKAGEFKPEFAGKLNFYLSAVDDLMRHPDDKPSIGLILCKSKERVIAEYALRDISKPIGIANWRTKLVASLPTELKGQLPTIKEIEAELGRENNKSRKA
jgi:predicted nuclease of restriction endonuclease-like (RecB) superfamily